jgi:serine/threonine-protein kinase
MALGKGARLGVYEIVGAIGAGGMGEVYRARDTKLGREVALKVLPEEFAADAERMGRFEREAKVLASLNHPNIASIYGFEDSGGVHALAMELVEGQTLAELVAKGSIPIDEALPIARQIAEGLEYAHERGIVHRDLKPANVKVTPDGVVKILDFGLAKALAGETAATDPSTSPTLSHLATQAGIILGTAAYMAPEQAKGKPVDRRADIWAFGCVLYEMLTGKKPFEGETVSDILAAVIRAEPDWAALPETTPRGIRNLLARCLKKDPKLRLRDIGEARIAIEERVSGAAEPATVREVSGPQAHPRNALWYRVIPWGIAVLAVFAAAFAVEHFRAAKAPQPTMQFSLAPPAEGSIDTALGAGAVLSPDGSRVAYVLRSGGSSRLYVRALDRAHGTALPGTDGAMDPFFSPDGEWVGFFAGGKMKKVATSGGAPVTICDAKDGRGAAWGKDGTILFTPTPSSPLERVSASGGSPVPVTRLNAEPEPESRSHRWPDLLPGGKEALFNIVHRKGNPLDHSDIGAVSLATGNYQILIRGGSYPRYASAGYIVYVAGTDLLAARFDAASLRVLGPPVTILRGVTTEPYSGGAQFSFSDNGMLLYLPERNQAAPQTRLVWVDRRGAVRPLTSVKHGLLFPRILPGGKRIVAEIQGQKAGIWLYDSTRDTLEPVDLNANNFAPGSAPALTPDGTRVIYNTIRKGEGLVIQRVDGAGGVLQLTSGTRDQIPDSVSPDGKRIVYTKPAATHTELMVVPLEGERKPRLLLSGPGNLGQAAYSPDGRWIAYVSDESGQAQVYVQASTGQGGRWQISSDGGTEPLWAHSGRELFYRAGNKMMEADVRTTPAFSVAKPKELFEGDFLSWSGPFQFAAPDYAVSPHDRRFLMVQPVGPVPVAAPAQGLQVVLNWPPLQKR